MIKKQESIRAYCARCRTRQEVQQATLTRTARGQAVVIGRCACCGARVWSFHAWDRPEDAARVVQENASSDAGAK